MCACAFILLPAFLYCGFGCLARVFDDMSQSYQLSIIEYVQSCFMTRFKDFFSLNFNFLLVYLVRSRLKIKLYYL